VAHKKPIAWVMTAAAAAALLLPLAAQAFDPYLVTPSAATLDQSPAFRHANMSAEAALDELRSRGVLFQVEGAARGVQTPLRLTGRLHGVHVHSALPDAQRTTTPFEICDARLALALDDFASILEKHDIDEVIHFSMYRPAAPALAVRSVRPPGLVPSATELPPLPAPSTDSEGVSPQKLQPSSSAPQGPMARIAPARSAAAGETAAPSRHPAGLAIDVAKLHKRGGEWLDVASHFSGHIGARTCGDGALMPADDKARELWSIICEALAGRVFTYVLTPNYNLAHRDHFHMEIKAGARWLLYH
jgi:D-alanyl-D-alanine dipeptidase